MFSISSSNPFEVLLAICFVVIAAAVFLGTFWVAIAYVYSTIRERWPEYTNKKRRSVVTNTLVTLTIIAWLIFLASTKLR